MDEGCLSVPGFYEKVKPRRAHPRACARRKRRKHEFDAEGLEAVCIQHEMDHLEGKLFVDYLSNLKRQPDSQQTGQTAKAKGELEARESCSTSSTREPRNLRFRRCITLLDRSEHRVAGLFGLHPAGRGGPAGPPAGASCRPSPVKAARARAWLSRCYQPANFKRSDEHVEALAALDADLMVVAAYGLLLPPAVLDAPRVGCVNIHASLLPRWRGASPIQQAILAGDPRQRRHPDEDGAGAGYRRYDCAAAAEIEPDWTAGEPARPAGAAGRRVADADDHARYRSTALAAGRPRTMRRPAYAPRLLRQAEAEVDWDKSRELARARGACVQSVAGQLQLRSTATPTCACGARARRPAASTRRSLGRSWRTTRDGVYVATGDGAADHRAAACPASDGNAPARR